MAVTIALAGDTMLGRGVAEAIATSGPGSVVADEVAEITRAADLCVLNLECCISERGEPWPDPRKRFFFRAPPAAVEVLVGLGVDCVTLANNHALDFGAAALLDTFEHLRAAGIAWVGAGRDAGEARMPAVLEANGVRVGVLGVADHPVGFAAGPASPGIAYAELERGDLGWLPGTIAGVDADAVLVTPHWGPNMVAEPLPYVRAAARGLREAGAALVAGHSAHVFHGASEPGTLYDLGDFVDDYAVDTGLRNDLGLLFLATIDASGGDARVARVEAVPLELGFCHTRLARGDDAAWIARRLEGACAALGTGVVREGGRLVIEAGPGSASGPPDPAAHGPE